MLLGPPLPKTSHGLLWPLGQAHLGKSYLLIEIKHCLNEQ